MAQVNNKCPVCSVGRARRCIFAACELDSPCSEAWRVHSPRCRMSGHSFPVLYGSSLHFPTRHRAQTGFIDSTRARVAVWRLGAACARRFGPLGLNPKWKVKTRCGQLTKTQKWGILGLGFTTLVDGLTQTPHKTPNDGARAIHPGRPRVAPKLLQVRSRCRRAWLRRAVAGGRRRLGGTVGRRGEQSVGGRGPARHRSAPVDGLGWSAALRAGSGLRARGVCNQLTAAPEPPWAPPPRNDQNVDPR